MNTSPIVLPFSEACERNKEVILDLINPVLEKISSVLEIGTGTAQHAIHFARKHPHLEWQTSDQAHYIQGIDAQLNASEVANVSRPVTLDVNQRPWSESGKRYDAVYTANTFHIMTMHDVEQFFEGLSAVLKANAYLMVYGPFKYAGKFTSESNAHFDNSLRSRQCGSAIRDFEWIVELAEKASLGLHHDYRMPANNQLLIFQTKIDKMTSLKNRHRKKGFNYYKIILWCD